MTKIISAFPCTGKTYCFQTEQTLRFSDSDSSEFSWTSPGVRNPDFPGNYINHIRELMGKNNLDVIFVSSHEAVRTGLVHAGLDFLLVYPERDRKEEYLRRARSRGSEEAFVVVLEKFWDQWIGQLNRQLGCQKVLLGPGECLSDIIPWCWSEVTSRKT